jgi:hypothetical protein
MVDKPVVTPILVRRSQKHSSDEVHATLFPEGVGSPQDLQELKEGLLRDVARRHARR